MHESDFSVGSSTTAVSLYDNFVPSYLARPDLNNDVPLPSIEQEEDFPNSLSFDLAAHISSPNDITEDVLVSVNPPTPFYESFEFEDGEESSRNCELDMSNTTDEHHERDETEEVIL